MAASLLELIRTSDSQHIGQAILRLAQRACQEDERGSLGGLSGLKSDSLRKDHKQAEEFGLSSPESSLLPESGDSVEASPYKEVGR